MAADVDIPNDCLPSARLSSIKVTIAFQEFLVIVDAIFVLVNMSRATVLAEVGAVRSCRNGAVEKAVFTVIGVHGLITLFPEELKFFLDAHFRGWVSKARMLKGFPCKVSDYSTAKPEAWVSQAAIVGADIFTNKKYEEICPTSANMRVPIVNKIELRSCLSTRMSLFLWSNLMAP